MSSDSILPRENRSLIEALSQDSHFETDQDFGPSSVDTPSIIHFRHKKQKKVNQETEISHPEFGPLTSSLQLEVDIGSNHFGDGNLGMIAILSHHSRFANDVTLQKYRSYARKLVDDAESVGLESSDEHTTYLNISDSGSNDIAYIHVPQEFDYSKLKQSLKLASEIFEFIADHQLKLHKEATSHIKKPI
jgi:hypothetical protein